MPSYVVVGASRGLGYEWLRQLSLNPTNLVIGLVRTPSTVQKRLSSDSITNVHLIAADMADNTSLVAAASSTAQLTGGTVDYLIINGVYTDPELDIHTPSEFAGKEDELSASMIESLKVNVLGVVFTINAFLPLVRKSRIRNITAITTGLADRDVVETSTTSFFMTYSSMKSALNMIITKFAIELKPEGIIFLALSPGLVDTSQDKPSPPKLTPEQINRLATMRTDIQNQYPGSKGPITTKESVELQRKVIEGMTIERSGAFLSHHGNKVWI